MKKIVVALTALLMLVFVAGCGTEKPKDKADEAILAFAELYTYNGTVDAAKTGMKKADIDKVGKQVDDQLLKSFAAYHLPDADQRDLTEYYLDRMQEKMDIQAKIKTASDTAPVVELSWNSIDGNKFAKMMQTDQRIVQLGQAVQEFRDAGGAGISKGLFFPGYRYEKSSESCELHGAHVSDALSGRYCRRTSVAERPDRLCDNGGDS